MANQTSKKIMQWPTGLKPRLLEGVLILTACFTIYLLLALATYHPLDPAWSTTGMSDVASNMGGRAGAWLSDIILYTLGYLGYFLPVMIAGVVISLFRQHFQKQSTWPLVLWCAGCLLLMGSASTLFSLYATNSSNHLPLSPGGVLGDSLAVLLSSWLNRLGATLVVLAGFLVGMTFLSGISWVRLGRAGVLRCVNVLPGLFRALGQIKLPRLPKSSKIASDGARVPQVLNQVNLTKKVDDFTVNKLVKPIDMTASKPQKKSVAIKSVKPTLSIKTAGLPSLNLLDNAEKTKKAGYSPVQIEALSRNVEARLSEFGIVVKVVGFCVGPVVTRFELELAPGVKVSRITGLAKDLARALSTTSVRVVEVIPGKAVIGLEIPNEQREVVRLKEILQSPSYQQAESLISLALGKDIAGHSVVVDVAKMPHLLVAGTTGSGKSVSVNAMLLSILLKARPDEVKLLMIDPKMLELSIYEGIPHLLAPVVTDMKEAANVLRWCVAEMDRRYRLMAALSVRNLSGYNSKINEAIAAGKPLLDPLMPPDLLDCAPALEALPQIVVVIDELADMMMVVGKKVEDLITRIAQKARAAGIHMILATQRPSVDVITGLIKANIPTRIAFQVSSRIDSRTILDQQGAEHLLGHGDMLYLPPGTSLPVRVHGAFVSDEEVLRVVAAWKERGAPQYLEEITRDEEEGERGSGLNEMGDAEADPLYDQAVALILETRRASISAVQRRFKIGYNRAARIMEAMEQAGLVSRMDNNGAREVLVPPARE